MIFWDVVRLALRIGGRIWLIPIPALGIFRNDRSSLDLTRKPISVVGDPHSPFFRILGAMPTLILVNSPSCRAVVQMLVSSAGKVRGVDAVLNRPAAIPQPPKCSVARSHFCTPPRLLRMFANIRARQTQRRSLPVNMR